MGLIHIRHIAKRGFAIAVHVLNMYHRSFTICLGFLVAIGIAISAQPHMLTNELMIDRVLEKTGESRATAITNLERLARETTDQSSLRFAYKANVSLLVEGVVYATVSVPQQHKNQVGNGSTQEELNSPVNFVSYSSLRWRIIYFIFIAYAVFTMAYWVLATYTPPSPRSKTSPHLTRSDQDDYGSFTAFCAECKATAEKARKSSRVMLIAGVGMWNAPFNLIQSEVP